MIRFVTKESLGFGCTGVGREEKRCPEKKRKKFTAEEKIVILKKHLLEKKAVSDICDEHGVHPTMFYRWQDIFFMDGASVFEKSNERPSVQMTRKVAQLEDKLQRKNEVLSELMEEHIALRNRRLER